MTIDDFIAEHGLGFTCKRVSPELFRCRITCGERGMNFFHHSVAEPTLPEALTRLAKAAHNHVKTKLPNESRATVSRDLASFRHWCVLYGYDFESQQDHQRYITIRRRAEQLKYVIGIPAYRQLLEIT